MGFEQITGPNFVTTSAVASSSVSGGFSPGIIFGLTLSNNAGTPNTNIDIASGNTRDIANTTNMNLTTTLTKNISTPWIVGSGNGGLDTGSIASSTWYHGFLINRSDTNVTDALFSTSPSNPLLPASYSTMRRIGAVMTNGSSNLTSFLQIPGTGEFFWGNSKPRDIAAASINSTPTLYTLSHVPLGIKTRIHGLVNAATAGTNALVSVSDPDLGVPPDTTYAVSISPDWNVIDVWANTSQQVYVSFGSGNATFSLWIQGWVDYRDAAF